MTTLAQAVCEKFLNLNEGGRELYLLQLAHDVTVSMRDMIHSDTSDGFYMRRARIQMLNELLHCIAGHLLKRRLGPMAAWPDDEIIVSVTRLARIAECENEMTVAMQRTLATSFGQEAIGTLIGGSDGNS